jgi:CRISPR-associated protein Csb2
LVLPVSNAKATAVGVAVEIQFLAGRYHANPWGRHLNEGAVEWPPSPWRFLRALVSVWRSDGSAGEATVRGLFGKLADPPSFHLVPITTGHLRHYVPHGEATPLMLNTFVVCQQAIAFTWPELTLTGEEQVAFDTILHRLTYLGRSESWCRARRVPLPSGAAQARPLNLDRSDAKIVTLLCAEPSVTLEQLEVTTGQVRRRRLNRPLGSEWVAYSLEPGLVEPESDSRPQLAIYVVRCPQPIAKEQTLRVSDRIRRELLRLHGKVHSPVFGGKVSGAVRADDHRHLHVLPEGEETIERVLLWAPDGFGPGEVEVLRQLSTVPAQGRQPKVRLLPWTIIQQPGPEVFGQSSAWKSATPYVPVRHCKIGGRDTVTEQIRRECQQRGLPEPEVTLAESSEGYVTRRPGQARPAGPPQMVGLKFSQPICGPLLLGANSHFGMGRFAPAQQREQ